MAQIRLIPSSTGASNTTYISVSNANNMYANTDNTTYADIQSTRNNNTTVYYAYLRGFNFNDVPSDAIINSFTVKIRGYVSQTGNTSLQLYNNETAISNATAQTFTTSVATRTFSNGSLTWDTIKGYGSNFGIRIPVFKARRQTGHTYVYGAEILVDYTIPVYHNVSVTNNSEATVSPTGTTTLLEGGSQAITFSGIQDKSEIVVRDNNVDITSQLVEGSGSRQTVFNPSSFVSSTTAVTNQNNACTDTGSTTYARMPIGQQEENHMIYAFDVSSIPSNATINSVSCVVKVSTSTSSNITTKDVQLYSGTSPKGSISTIPTTTGGTVTLSPGTWTRQELENIRIRFDGYYNGTYSNYNIDFYGANLVVNYTTDDKEFTYTISNISADHTIVVTDGNVTKYAVNATSSYVGATVSPTTQQVVQGHSATVNIDVDNLYEIKVKDNGTDVTSSLVGSNGTYTYTITNIQTAHTISVTEATYYSLVASSSHDTATISPAMMKVYQGQNAVFTINGNVSDLILKDNGVDVTSSISNGSYTITNVTAIHTLTILNKPADHIKIDGSYKKVGKVFKKIEGAWVEINKTAFDDFVSTNIMMYGGNISISEIGNVETNGDVVNININNNALSTGTYKLIYEDEHREPLDSVDKITEFTI